MEEKKLYIEDFPNISLNGTGQVKVKCPLCIDRRKNKADRSLSINRETKAYHCHYCNAAGVLKYKDEKLNNTVIQFFKPEKKEYKRPDKIVKIEDNMYDKSFIEYFNQRGISEKTMKTVGITQEKERFGNVNIGCIGFNFLLEGDVINTKYRTRDKKFKLISGAELIPYNIDSIHPSTYEDNEEKYALFTEGEIDCMTWVECGYPHAVSAPNGANANMEYLDNYIDEYFEPLDTIYISVDNDRKGMEFRYELLRRFGSAKCRIIDYPSPCKDINEVMVQYGRKAVKDCFENYTEIKPEGVMELRDVETNLDFLFHNGFQPGVKIGMPTIDQYLSFRIGMLIVVTGVPTSGKALSLDTPLPSPDGWIKMGDIKIGDKLYDEKGEMCTVTFVTPIQHNRNCYKMIFSDNSEVICDEEHLWVTRDDKARRSNYNRRKTIEKNGDDNIRQRGTDQSYKRTYPKERTTKEIIETLYVENGKRLNHSIAIQGALNCTKVSLPIEPYVLGAWLADGTASAGCINTGDYDVIKKIESYGYTITKHKYEYQYGILKLITRIKAIGLYNNKHIPSIYLRSSIEQRRELLCGLMDSDGYCDKTGNCEYYSVVKELADNVYELVVSLGMKATIRVKKAYLNGERKKDCYVISFTPNFECFTLERKRSKLREKYSDKANWRYIKEVVPVESVPVRCIQVDSPNHMYLCGKSMIPTHNTYMLNFLLSKLNILHDWKIAFFSPEFYPVSDHVGQMMETLGGLRFHSENYNDMVYIAMKDYVNNNFFWIDPDDTDIHSVMDRAIYLIKRKGVKALVIDPFNSLTDKEYKAGRKDEYISDFLQTLRAFARKYGIAVFLVMHPTKMVKQDNGLYPVCDLYNCKGASEVYDKADIGLSMWRNEFEDYCELYIVKMKFRSMGSKGHISMKFNMNNGRYVELGGDATEMLKGGTDIKRMSVNWDNSNYIINKIKNKQSRPNNIDFTPEYHIYNGYQQGNDTSVPFEAPSDECPF